MSPANANITLAYVALSGLSSEADDIFNIRATNYTAALSLVNGSFFCFFFTIYSRQTFVRLKLHIVTQCCSQQWGCDGWLMLALTPQGSPSYVLNHTPPFDANVGWHACTSSCFIITCMPRENSSYALLSLTLLWWTVNFKIFTQTWKNKCDWSAWRRQFCLILLLCHVCLSNNFLWFFFFLLEGYVREILLRNPCISHARLQTIWAIITTPLTCWTFYTEIWG